MDKVIANRQSNVAAHQTGQSRLIFLVCFLFGFCLFLPYLVMVPDASDSARSQSTGKNFQFWTPSAKTRNSKNIEPWEKLESDDKVRDFQKKLQSDPRIISFRVYETYGSVSGFGSYGRKFGYWWKVGIKQGYTLEEFQDFYQLFWGNDRPVDIEVHHETGQPKR